MPRNGFNHNPSFGLSDNAPSTPSALYEKSPAVTSRPRKHSRVWLYAQYIRSSITTPVRAGCTPQPNCLIGPPPLLVRPVNCALKNVLLLPAGRTGAIAVPPNVPEEQC